MSVLNIYVSVGNILKTFNHQNIVHTRWFNMDMSLVFYREINSKRNEKRFSKFQVNVKRLAMSFKVSNF